MHILTYVILTLEFLFKVYVKSNAMLSKVK